MTKENVNWLQEYECKLFYKITDAPSELRSQKEIDIHKRVRALMERTYKKKPELFD